MKRQNEALTKIKNTLEEECKIKRKHIEEIQKEIHSMKQNEIVNFL